MGFFWSPKKAKAADLHINTCGILNQAHTNYILDNDISSEGTCLVIIAKDITFDLNGHSITYNTIEQAAPVYGISLGSPTVWLNLDSAGLRIKNGSIVQGEPGSQYGDAISARRANAVNVELSYLNITVNGDSTHSLYTPGGTGWNIHHNTLTGNLTSITNRYAFDGYAILVTAASNSTIHDNTIRGGHGGILVSSNGGSVYNNDVSHKQLSGNGYGIDAYNCQDVQIYNNYVHTTDGLGVAAGDWYRNVEIFNNRVDVQQGPTTESGIGVNAWGMKFRTYPDIVKNGLPSKNLKVHDNTVKVTTGLGLMSRCGGIGIYDDHDDLNNEYYNNNVTAITTYADYPAAGLKIAGLPIQNGATATNSHTRIYHNTITASTYNIWFATEDGEGVDNFRLESNTLIKGPSPTGSGANPLDYHTLRDGYDMVATSNHTLLDTTTQDGANVDDIYLSGSIDSTDTYSFYVKWYLNVKAKDSSNQPVANATVTATADGGTAETVTGTTDATGKTRLELTEYYRYGIVNNQPTSNYNRYTPHTINISKTGVGAAQAQVTMDASKSLDVVLSPGPSLVKQADKSSATSGETITYTLTYLNPTADTLANAKIEDPIPTGTIYITGSATNGGSFNATENKVIWNIASLSPGANGTVSFQVRTQ